MKGAVSFSEVITSKNDNNAISHTLRLCAFLLLLFFLPVLSNMISPTCKLLWRDTRQNCHPYKSHMYTFFFFLSKEQCQMSSDGEHHVSLLWRGILTKSLSIQISHICIFEYPQSSDLKS